MALTPDDVVTKQFQHVRFKEGFDPDEVDDFLDEIVVEWRKTIEENNELKAKLAQYESGEAAPAEAAAPVEAAPVVEETPEPVAEPVEPAPVAAPEPSSTATSAASIIERAQRLHDEHVAEGKQMAEQLVDEAKAEADRILGEAETKQRELNEKYERERTTLEGRITELRHFERDYRAQMRSYFEGKLKDLDSSGSASGDTPVSAIGL
ncbi:DivIVA domain-containing protein [Microbacterium marinilacus]|uniref:Cell wall synthesis protein Wag31 n=1 Tax=Microbacterium marinilacus TaxID=415209 RepID=A0ABP7B417_9MICO|nr:V-type ATPase subunit subunit G family protein [Microbacterium marinilacus]MBY0687812.1 DivIVA domain-containing protein [Microbacterium marinilacus]